MQKSVAFGLGLAKNCSVQLFDAWLKKQACACRTKRQWAQFAKVAGTLCSILWEQKRLLHFVACNSWRIIAKNNLADFALDARAVGQILAMGKTHLRL